MVIVVVIGLPVKRWIDPSSKVVARSPWLPRVDVIVVMWLRWWG